MKNWQRLHQNPALFDTFWMREKVYAAIRAFFTQEGFHEVETPLLVEHPGTEPFLEVFATELLQPKATAATSTASTEFQRRPAFLLTSPEFGMKKLLVAGSGPIFQICKSFRNGEGISSRHNPEFTIMEWYRPNADYTAIMDDCENLLRALLVATRSADQEKTSYLLEYQGKTYDLSPGFEKISVAEAFQKYVGVDDETLLSPEKLKAAAAQKGYAVTEQTTWEEVYNQLLLNEIEPHLGQNKPTFLYDYPVSQAALSRPKASDPRFAERFELYLAGLELGNAFSELTDADEQEKRFTAELAERAKLGKTPYTLDHDYIDALRVGMPPTGGIAVGVDRLVMLFANVPDLRDVTFFPVLDVFDDQVSEKK